MIKNARDMDYWSLRSALSKIVPRQSQLALGSGDQYKMKQKGRKSNYHQYNLETGETLKLERLLDTEGLNSFVEVSLRAQSCPMPLNMDLWDGLKCPFGCKYCFADYFRHSLYTSFFDNGKSLGLRHGNPEVYRTEMDKLMPHVGEPVEGENEVLNAIRLKLPMRLGIRFEDFVPSEKEVGVSLSLLNYLADHDYPVMINTKSDLPGDPEYIEALARNKGKAAIHFTLISCDDEFLGAIEPGAPTFHQRLHAARKLTDAGVRVVARIEPFMVFLNDDKAMVDEYIGWIKEAGIRHLTFDSYSYSANSKGLEANFSKIGMDFRRMFLLSSDSQGLSSLLLGKFMEYFRSQGLSCSTFDQGNVPDNDDWICCSVGDWFEGGFNWGSGVIALKFIQSRGLKPTRWSDFDAFVKAKGGWLSTKIRTEVHTLWNGEGDMAWPVYWGQGIESFGADKDGTVWCWREDHDFRYDLADNLMGNTAPGTLGIVAQGEKNP